VKFESLGIGEVEMREVGGERWLLMEDSYSKGSASGFERLSSPRFPFLSTIIKVRRPVCSL
jgi:hypothetical protein